jgi:ribose 5-phosphate isomerase B
VSGATAQQLEPLIKMALERVLAREQRCPPGAGAGAGPGQGAPAAPAPAPFVKPEAKVELGKPVTNRGEVVIGSDHGGFDLKQQLVRYLRDVGYRVRDLGCHSTDAVDYPDFALQVAAAVAKGDAWRGIMVDGVGVGSGMAANKVPGVRAAVCFDVFSTRNAREHNDANVMCCGGRVLEPARAREMARVFLDTEFGGDRHLRRVQKVMAIEKMFLDAAAGRRA